MQRLTAVTVLVSAAALTALCDFSVRVICLEGQKGVRVA